jgi:GNAT superfamily N-acetyltransferase
MNLDFKQVKTDRLSIDRYAALLKIVFHNPDMFGKEYMEWLYRDNPFGEAVGFDAYDGEVLAAHYVTTPVNYAYNGRQWKGLLSLNTATHPDYQGKGLFTKLAGETYNYASQNGYEFVIGVANQNSTHGFLKKLDFKLISPLDVYLILGSGVETKVSSDSLFTSSTDDTYIKWRMKNPQTSYFVSNGLYYSKTHNRFIDVCMGTKYKQTSMNNNAQMIRMTMGVNNNPKALFKFKLPDKLKPSPLNLILKPLVSSFPELEKKDIFFETMDFDAY